MDREPADKPLVSVVVATYNMAGFLALAIRSALAQTYRNIEVLIIDDGSTDATAEVVAPFLADARVRYQTQANGGQAVAKNRGIRESTGEYVAFLDADDLWAPDKLEAQIPLFAASRVVGIVYSAFAYIDEKGNQLPHVPDELHRGRVSGPLLISNFVGFSASVVKRECFERLGSFKESLGMGIDYDLWLRFSTQYEFDYIDRPLLYYRGWPGQMSKNWKTRYLSGIEIMKNFLREFPDAVDKRTANEAWAHTYAGFGYCMRGSRRREALSLYLRALRFKPDYLPAWRGIAATLLGR
jgi:glycosyltransferase involved in cell wall biosynthesis